MVPTPADEHQGHFKGDIRFSTKHSLGVRYNMVRWKKDNESGGFNLPGTGFMWDNNVDTLHGTFVTVDTTDDHHFVFYELYTDQAAIDAHRAAPHFAAWRLAAAEHVVSGSQVNTITEHGRERDHHRRPPHR